MTATNDLEVVSAQELRSLNPAQVPAKCRSLAAIDQTLTDLGAFGEVRIGKSKDRVRFIEILESRDTLKIGND